MKSTCWQHIFQEPHWFQQYCIQTGQLWMVWVDFGLESDTVW